MVRTKIAFVRTLPAVAALLALVAWSAPAPAGSIPWRTGPAEVKARTPTEIEARLLALAARSAETRRIVVQFDRPVDDSLRARLESGGLHLLGYVGNRAFFASLATNRLDAAILSRIPGLVGVEEIRPEWKLHPMLAAGQSPDWAVVAHQADGTPIVVTYVLLHRDVDLQTEGLDAVAACGAEVRGLLQSINGLVIALPENLIPQLASQDAVQWVEPALPLLTPVNDSNRARTGADIVQAPPYNLNGSGVTVLVYDGGKARDTHVDFEGRLTTHDSANQAAHATHVSGTIGGAGIANPTYKGMAPGVRLLSYALQQEGGLHMGFLYTDPCDIEHDYSEAIQVYGADISNNSIGTNTAQNGFPCEWEGDYGVTDVLIDTIVRGDGSNPLFSAPFRVVWANGNERSSGRCGKEYHTTAPPACAKNHITVGALNSNDDSMTNFSSWGPADDGRLKPDLSAPGCEVGNDNGVTSCHSSSDTAYTVMCGTSMASPTVCGLAALLLQDYRAQFPGLSDPRNSTLKILFAHTAVDLGNPGPDYQFGYGSVRIQPAVDFMRTGSFLENQVSQGQTFSVVARVNPGEPLKVTLAWDDVPGTPNVIPALVNDLDLRVYGPSGSRAFPWTLGGLADPAAPAVRTQEDHLNNIEQVVVDDPEPGVWIIKVYGYFVPEGPQPFSLAVSPQLAGCDSRGVISFDQAQYGCQGPANLEVMDCDLNTDPNQAETVSVTIASDSEPQGESCLLVETGPDTADFRGSMPLDLVNSPGVLQVANGDALLATYVDADDGQGGHNVSVHASAVVDCQGPVISRVQVRDITLTTARVTFQTDEPAAVTVRYGLACDSLTLSVSNLRPDTVHSLELAGLQPDTRYYFAIDATDSQGNQTTDDNQGACHWFVTAQLICEFPLDTDPGWTTEGDWEFGQPTGGGVYLCHDPKSGHTGDNVYGYNLDGNYTGGMPAYYLTTTALDCAGRSGVELHFWRWLGVDWPDTASLQVSNDGSTWVTIWDNGGSRVCDQGLGWVHVAYDISSVADNQPAVYVRWGMGPTSDYSIFPGWNIDDVAIWTAGMAEPTCYDGIQNQGEDRIDCGGPCPSCECLADEQCDDGEPCNGIEVCDAFGHCRPGSITDCNGNGWEDFCDIAEGTSTDLNHNGVPDECEGLGDMNCDGRTDFGDINPFVLRLADPAQYASQYPDCPDAHGDINGDGSVGFGDINPFVRLLSGP
jgi:hypothetical protein